MKRKMRRIPRSKWSTIGKLLSKPQQRRDLTLVKRLCAKYGHQPSLIAYLVSVLAGQLWDAHKQFFNRCREIRVLGDPLFQNKTGDENTYYWLATAYNEWGWNEHALTINSAAIKKAPKDITLWSQRTDILVSLGRFKEALTANKRAIRLAQNKAEKRRFLPEQARILFRLGRFRDARAIAKKASPFDGSWLRWLKDELDQKHST